MRKLTIAVLALALLMLSGCAAATYATRGAPVAPLYADESGPFMVTENSLGEKRGESCSQSLLGLVVTGDASIASAARKGGITRVGAVDIRYQNILGIIATYCVVVSGD